MKLWQKVFLVSLALILLAINITAGAILYSSHQLMLEREQEQAAKQHGYLSATLQNRVIYERLNQKQPLLPTDSVDKLLKNLVISQTGQDGIAIYRGSMEISRFQAHPLTQVFHNEVVQSSDNAVRITITEQDGKRYILTGSSASIEGNRYSLFTITDISDVYGNLDDQLQRVRTVSLVFAGMIGCVLMLFVLRLMTPFHRIHTSLHRISAGDYDLRIPEKGGQEFRELAKSINQMATATQANINRVEGLAESRKQFIDNFAHEMKTPLTSILGFADILRITKQVNEDVRQEYAGIIVEETKRLQSLSGKLMELITAGNTALDLEVVTADELLDDTARVMTPLLQQRQLTLSVEVADNVALTVDRSLFASLLYNLVDNASKASAVGQEISLACRKTPDGICLSVTDHGIGISPEALKKVTEPFYMADKARTRKAGGAGLGLALCAEIVRRHNATLDIDSRLGEGTTVTVTMSDKEGFV